MYGKKCKFLVRIFEKESECWICFRMEDDEMGVQMKLWVATIEKQQLCDLKYR